MAIVNHLDLQSYLPIVAFLAMGLTMSLVLLVLSLLRGKSRPDPEKNAPYECGFKEFSDTRVKFDVRFYLVAILFIIFDIEVAFLFPWAKNLKEIGIYSFWSMIVFLGVLTVAFVYEWMKGALEWE